MAKESRNCHMRPPCVSSHPYAVNNASYSSRN